MRARACPPAGPRPFGCLQICSFAGMCKAKSRLPLGQCTADSMPCRPDWLRENNQTSMSRKKLLQIRIWQWPTNLQRNERNLYSKSRFLMFSEQLALTRIYYLHDLTKLTNNGDSKEATKVWICTEQKLLEPCVFSYKSDKNPWILKDGRMWTQNFKITIVI